MNQNNIGISGLLFKIGQHFVACISFIAACVLGLCISAHAQNKKPDTSSDLARQNLNLVAASSTQIKAVLAQDPGLMVAIKKWVAQDATDHGQVLSDDDLTDAAIFDRLDADPLFRSVATRFVQQYGFLVPEVNPDSEMGKQEQLLMQERAKLVAQQQQQLVQSHTNAPQSPPAVPTGGCVQGAGTECSSHNQTPTVLPEEIAQPSLPTAPGSPQNPGEQISPASPNGNGSSLERTQYIEAPGQSDGDLSMLGLSTAPTASGGNSAGPDDSLSLSQSPNDPPAGNLGYAAGQNGQPQDFEASSPAHPQYSLSPQGEQFEARTTQPTLIRAADPYRDVPSLYDMYLQAIPQPSTPKRFGFEVFENGIRDPQSIPMDLPVGPDYVVGPGDGLAIDLWGGVSQRLYATVDREGRVTLPEIGPVLVSGRSLANVQENLQQALRTQFRDISVDVSLSRLRTIRVYEVGDVVRPGAYDISSLSTPLNALFAAGGSTAQGSLRIVKHYRGNQLIEEVDLYDLLLHGVKNGMARLENGDTVLVPPLGPQVTVEGMVRRPAIYELKDEKTLAAVLELAGGILPAATLRHVEVQRLVAHQKQTMLSLDIPESDDSTDVTQKLDSFQIQDGDRIRIYPIAPYNQDAVYLEGHVLRPGRYSFQKDMRVGDLITSYKDLLPEPALQYAEIIRLNAPDFHPSVQSFDLKAAMDQPSNSPVLQPMDTVRIFSRFDFEDPPAISIWGDVRAPGTYQTSGEIHLADAVHLAGGLSPNANTQDVQVFRYLPDGKSRIFSVRLDKALDGDPTDNIVLQSRDRLLIHGNPDALQPATVYVKGEVERPGRYPLTTNMTVADLIMAGGGLKPSADTKEGELTSYDFSDARPDQIQLTAQHQEFAVSAAMSGDPSSNMKLQNGDVVTIRQVPGWDDLGASIAVKGEVVHPGTYGIRPGERLSSVLQRAGGFQADAYPYGAVLERVEVRELESKEQDQMVVRLRNEGAELQGMPQATDAQKAEKLITLQQYETVLTQLSANSPVGRVAIRISSTIKDWKNTSEDIQVHAGDVLMIPRRPDFVMVTGQVFSPTAVSYRPGKSAKWYLNQSGGPTNLANKKAIFVMRADGSVIGSRSGLLSGDPLGAALEPGDTVIVPEKAIGGGLPWQNLFTSAQVASSVASTLFIALHY